MGDTGHGNNYAYKTMTECKKCKIFEMAIPRFSAPGQLNHDYMD